MNGYEQFPMGQMGQNPGYNPSFGQSPVQVDRQDPRAQQYSNPRYSQPAYGGGQQMNFQPNYIMQAPSYLQAGQYGRGMNNQTLVRVLSRAEAESYYVVPGNTVAMISNDNRHLYVKSVAETGEPRFERYSLIPEHDEVQQESPVIAPGAAVDPAQYVTRKEYDDLKGELDRVVEAMRQLMERMKNDGRSEE